MMGERQVRQDALFYEFSLERHVPEKHLLRAIDRFVELDGLRRELEPFYSAIGRPSIGRKSPHADRPSGYLAGDHKAGGSVEPGAPRMGQLL